MRKRIRSLSATTVIFLAFSQLLPTATAANSLPQTKQGSEYGRAAQGVAAWLRAASVKTPEGMAWYADPTDKTTILTNLYTGTPGVVLFFLEAHHATKDASYLADARAGADYLVANFEKEKESGLYTGIAGIGFALLETYKATRDEKYREAARRVVQLLGERAKPVDARPQSRLYIVGAEWSQTTDIIAGGAGTGLFLLYAAKELGDAALGRRARELAIRAGERLAALGKPEAGGLKWAMNDSFPRLMPNFSHGAAGIAYFLATLYQQTKQRRFLEAARAGGRYLQAIARTEGDICLIFHNEPEGKDLYYLSWCHGPAGTARLFYRLHEITGERQWMDWVEKSARALLTSGIPERQTPGFWNNVSQCCGSAGVGEFLLSLYQISRDKRYLDFVKRVTDNLLARATREQGGLKWIQAEHRRQPDLLIAQTGYMQGAAGIGIFLLRLDAWERGSKPLIRFPDTPF